MLQRETCSPASSTVHTGNMQPAVPSTSDARRSDVTTGQTEDSDRLVAATLVALETGDMTPLIKEELKYTIQSRRVSQGKRELRVTFQQPHPYKLTPEEEERVKIRREQNRLAAQKFRRKQKEEAHVSNKRIQRLESANTRLRDELRQLREERTHLALRLESHLKVCPGIGTPRLGT